MKSWLNLVIRLSYNERARTSVRHFKNPMADISCGATNSQIWAVSASVCNEKKLDVKKNVIVGMYSLVVEQSIVVQQVTGSTPVVPFGHFPPV